MKSAPIELLSREEFARLDVPERRKYIHSKSKKQMKKMCNMYGVDDHGGAFVLMHKLVNMK